MSSEMSRSAEAGAVSTAFTLLAIASTYPLIRGLATHVASDLGDPLLVAWMLAWDADRLRHGLAGVWDAPNFFPYRHTLLYSEHFLGVAIFTAPLQWMTGNPILVYNLAFLASFVLAGGGMYVLARWLTGRRDAALVAGAIFAFHPFRASHFSHLQLLVVGWLPLSVWALHRYFRTRRLRDLLGCVVFYVLQALTSGYFAYFALVPLIIVGAWEWWRSRWVAPRLAVHVGVAAALAAAVMLPVVGAYAELRKESGQRRQLDEITSQSAGLGDYVSAAPSLRMWGGIGKGRGEHELFPGLVAIALAVFSIPMRRRSGAIWCYGAILLTAFVLSLGPAPTLFGYSIGVPGPYALLLRVVPGFDGLRVPARFAVVAQMALAVLAAFGFVWLSDRIAAWSGKASAERQARFARIATTAALVVLIAAEGWAKIGTPEFDYRGDPHNRGAYAYLKSLPRGAAIELPTMAERVLDEFTYQYMTLVHGHPIVNGHSGYLTPLVVWLRGGHSPLREAGRQRDAIDMLRSIGVRYIVLHRDAYEDRSLRDELLENLASGRGVIEKRTFDRVTVAALVPIDLPARDSNASRVPSAAMVVRASDSPDRLPALFDGDPDSRWLTARPQSGDEWLALELDRPRNIAAVRLQLGTRSFGDYPRDLLIESVGATGTQPLFRGSVLPHLARGIIANGDYPFIEIALPPNATKTLRLSQHGTTRSFFWSIHELHVLERD